MTTAGQPLIHLDGVTKVFVTDEVETHARAGIHLEIKSGQDIVIEGNVFENLWIADHSGYPIVFTPRNQMLSLFRQRSTSACFGSATIWARAFAAM